MCRIIESRLIFDAVMPSTLKLQLTFCWTTVSNYANQWPVT